MSAEPLTSLIRRAERRVGRPFRGLNQTAVSAGTLRAQGLRVARDEVGYPIDAWELFFGKDDEVPTLVYGRTIAEAFACALRPVLAEARERRSRRKG